MEGASWKGGKETEFCPQPGNLDENPEPQKRTYLANALIFSLVRPWGENPHTPWETSDVQKLRLINVLRGPAWAGSCEM